MIDGSVSVDAVSVKRSELDGMTRELKVDVSVKMGEDKVENSEIVMVGKVNVEPRSIETSVLE